MTRIRQSRKEAKMNDYSVSNKGKEQTRRFITERAQAATQHKKTALPSIEEIRRQLGWVLIVRQH
jgi:hypothetical protein